VIITPFKKHENVMVPIDDHYVVAKIIDIQEDQLIVEYMTKKKNSVMVEKRLNVLKHIKKIP
jgi:hypothetical protein